MKALEEVSIFIIIIMIIIIIIISKFYIAHVYTKQGLKALSIYNVHYTDLWVIEVMNSETQLCSIL